MTSGARYTALVTEAAPRVRAEIEPRLARALTRVIYALAREVADIMAGTAPALRAAAFDGWDPWHALEAARRELEEQWEDRADDVTFRPRMDAARLTTAPALAEFGVDFATASPLLEGAVKGTLGNRTSPRLLDPAWDAITEALQTAIDTGVGPRPTVQLMLKGVTTSAAPGETTLGRRRAMTIARTEMTRVQNAASVEMAILTEAATSKTWMSTLDRRTRPSHRAANEQTVPIREMFQVGSGRGQYPGDPALPAQESVLCRCTVVYV